MSVSGDLELTKAKLTSEMHKQLHSEIAHFPRSELRNPDIIVNAQNGSNRAVESVLARGEDVYASW